MASRYSTRSGRLSSEKEKMIKKINERRAQIARDVAAGKLPQNALDRYENAMRAAAGDYIHEGLSRRADARSGGERMRVVSIGHGKEALENINMEDLQALLQRSTSGEMQREMKRQYAQEYNVPVRSITSEDMRQFINDIDFVNTYIDQHPDRAYDKESHSGAFAIFRGKKGIRSYFELREAINTYETQPDEVPPFDAEEVYFT